MLGDYPLEFFTWMLLLPVILGALIGLVVGVAFAAVMGLTALNHGLAALVRRAVDTVRARRSVRAADRPLPASDEP